jgi:hypothetical protein
MNDTISPKILRLFQNQFLDEYCDAQSIKPLCEFENGILERTANINEALLVARHQTNNQIIKMIQKKGTNNAELSGFYILYPLTCEGEKLIEGGDIRNSRQIATSHLCNDSQPVFALYLSMVFGKDRATQAYLIYLLYRDIKKIIRANREIRFLYVRPVTEDGFRAVEKHHFHRFREDSGIYRRAVMKNKAGEIE